MRRRNGNGSKPAMTWMFFLFGLASLAGQVLLLREILAVFHGTEISIGIFYAAWLAGIGVGATVGVRVTRKRSAQLHGLFLHSISALGGSLLIQIVLIRNAPWLLSIAPAELAPLHGIGAAAPAGTFAAAFLTGFLFPVGCGCIADADDRLIARLYAFEALGSLAAGLILSSWLLTRLDAVRIAAVAGMFLGLAAAAAALRWKKPSAFYSSLPLMACCLILLSPLGQTLIDWTILTRWQTLHPGLKLVLSGSTPYQEVEIASLGRQVSMFSNGKIVCSFPDRRAADGLTALIVSQNPDARRVLLVGGGVGNLVGSLLQYPIEKLDVIEPDPWAFKLAEQFLPPEEREALKDPRVEIIFTDGRLYVNRLKEATYNIVVTMIPDPVSSFWNRYYTLEYFQAAAKALTPNGFLFTRATSAENFWGASVASYAGSVYHTLKDVFSDVKGTPGDETFFFASRATGLLTLDPDALAARYAKIGVASIDPVMFMSFLPREKTAFVARELAQSPALINSDFRPVSTSLAMILWGRFSGSAWVEALNTIRRGGVLVYLIPLAFFLAARITFRARFGPRQSREAKFQTLLAMAAVGAAAMGAQIVLINAYQSLFGYVFERIGLLAGVFMTGLATGAFASGKALARISRKDKAIGAALGLFALLCLSIPPVLERLKGNDPFTIEIALFVAVFASGVLTAAVFSLAASRYLGLDPDAARASGRTDAADHYGAAVGALVTGALLIPLLSISEACLALACAALAPAVLIVLEWVFERFDASLDRYRPRRGGSFPFDRTTWLLLFAVGAAFAWRVFIGPPGAAPAVRFSDETLEQVSGSRGFTFADQPFPHYVGGTRSAGDRTFSLSTASVAWDVRGYGGPMNLLVSVSDRGVIKGVRIVESRETPAYLHGIDGWLGRFTGLSIFDAGTERIDALTGATITRRAIIDILNRTGETIRGPLLGLPKGEAAPPAASRWAAFFRDARWWLVVGLFAFFALAFHWRSRMIRLICLALSLAILGIYLNAPFTAMDGANLMRGQISAADAPWRATLILGVILISALWGQAFCGFLCPFGALQEFLSVRSLKRRPTQRLEMTARYSKFVILALVLCLFLITDDLVWFSFSPLQHFFKGSMEGWVLWLSLTVLLASLVYFRFWCRYLCPAGAFLALFNKLNILRTWAPRPIPGRCDLGVSLKNDVDCIHCCRCLFKDKAASGGQ
jgi:spermidine synthase